MKIHRSVGGAIATAAALTLLVTAKTNAQDTTRRVTSEQRIPVRKDAATTTVREGDVTRRTAAGEVRLPPTRERIDSLEALAESYRSRIDSLERVNVSFASRLDATDRLIASLRDSLNIVRGELATAREELASVKTELTATTARTGRIADSLQRLNTRFILFRNRSMFGNSGFYVGLGTGPAYTMGALNDFGYIEGMQITVPIGWQKTGNTFGIRSELAWQNYDGRFVASRPNVDPNVYSATLMANASFPFNSAKTHSIYLMAGGGVYHFRDFRENTALGEAFGATGDNAETKFGFTGGAGVQFHILGATYLFLQSTIHQVSADQVVAPATGKSLRWVPVVLGVAIR
ncbi:MAG TPA: outer membrane beta-barrel protein [Gemmatimonadaceae bacterium]|jgi:opacity protein-like surface antigen|nr:outer membrane beta-barrel protein [Gemmatimonadaceae bacterium]